MNLPCSVREIAREKIKYFVPLDNDGQDLKRREIMQDFEASHFVARHNINRNTLIRLTTFISSAIPFAHRSLGASLR